jgi:hypothetical protein
MRKTGYWFLAVMVVVVFGFTFNAMAEEGLTDTEIHLGQWGPQTGPVAAWGSVARATGDYFKMINAEGGIHGRKIVYHMFDDAYNPAKTKAGNARSPGWDRPQGLHIGSPRRINTCLLFIRYIISRPSYWFGTRLKKWVSSEWPSPTKTMITVKTALPLPARNSSPMA